MGRLVHPDQGPDADPLQARDHRVGLCALPDSGHSSFCHSSRAACASSPWRSCATATAIARARSSRSVSSCGPPSLRSFLSSVSSARCSCSRPLLLPGRVRRSGISFSPRAARNTGCGTEVARGGCRSNVLKARPQANVRTNVLNARRATKRRPGFGDHSPGAAGDRVARLLSGRGLRAGAAASPAPIAAAARVPGRRRCRPASATASRTAGGSGAGPFLPARLPRCARPLVRRSEGGARIRRSAAPRRRSARSAARPGTPPAT